MKNSLRMAGAVLATVVAAGLGIVVAASPAHAITDGFPDGTRTIRNYGSGLCLEPAGSGWGEPILQQHCNGSLTQRWTRISATATHDLILNVGTRNCLDVRDGVNADRTVVQQWGCRNVPSMRWRTSTLIPDLYFKIISAIGSRCLDVAGGSLQPGAQLQIYACTSGTSNTAQIFEVQHA
jgi:ricin-type beta-trefoil lectin protein